MTEVRLNPLSLPSSAATRFAIFLATGTAVSIWLGITLRNYPPHIHFVVSQVDAVFAITLLIGVYLLAIVLFAIHPSTQRRSFGATSILEPSSALATMVAEIATELRVRRPKIYVDRDITNSDAIAFGYLGWQSIAIGRGLLLMAAKRPSEARARLAHELGHFANGDVLYAFASISLLRSLIAALLAGGVYLAAKFGWEGYQIILDLDKDLSTAAARSQMGSAVLHIVLTRWGAVTIIFLGGLLAWGVILIGEHRSLLREREFLADARAAQCVGESNVVAALSQSRQKRWVDALGPLYRYLDAHPAVEDRVQCLDRPELVGMASTAWFFGFGYFVGVTFVAMMEAARPFQLFSSLSNNGVSSENAHEIFAYVMGNSPLAVALMIVIFLPLALVAILSILVALLHTVASFQFGQQAWIPWSLRQALNSIVLGVGLIAAVQLLNPFNLQEIKNVPQTIVRLSAFPIGGIGPLIGYALLLLSVGPIVAWIFRGRRTNRISSTNWFFFLAVLAFTFYVVADFLGSLINPAPNAPFGLIVLLHSAELVSALTIAVLYGSILRGFADDTGTRANSAAAPWLLRSSGSTAQVSAGPFPPALRAPFRLAAVRTPLIVFSLLFASSGALWGEYLWKQSESNADRARFAEQSGIAQSLRRKGDYGPALEAYNQLLELAKIENLKSKSPLTELDMAAAYHGVAQVLRDKGDLSGALDPTNKSLQIRKSVASSYPDVMYYQSLLSNAYAFLGDIQDEMENKLEAREAYRNALGVREETIRMNPGQLDWRLNLAELHKDLGLTETEDLQASRSHFVQAASIIQDLKQQFPDVDSERYISWNSELLSIFQNLADSMERTEEHQEAVVLLNQAISLGEDLITKDSKRASNISTLAYCYGDLGRLKYKASEFEASLTANRRAAFLSEQLLVIEGTSWRTLEQVADYYSNAAAASNRLDDLTTEIDLDKKSIGYMERALDVDPVNRALRQRLSAKYQSLAGELKQAGDSDASAIDLQRKVLGLQEFLANSDPNDTSLQVALALAYWRLGSFENSASNLTNATNILEKLALAGRLDETAAGYLRTLKGNGQQRSPR